MLEPIILYRNYYAWDAFRKVGRKERKSSYGKSTSSVEMVAGVAWVFEKAVVWSEGQSERKIVEGFRDAWGFTHKKKGFGHYVGSVFMAVPTNHVHILYSWIQGDPKVERRRDIKDYDRKHRITGLARSSITFNLDRFKGDKPPKKRVSAKAEKLLASRVKAKTENAPRRRKEPKVVAKKEGQATLSFG